MIFKKLSHLTAIPILTTPSDGDQVCCTLTSSEVYTYTNVAQCAASATCNIQCAIPAAFSCGDDLTDIRDGKKYVPY